MPVSNAGVFHAFLTSACELLLDVAAKDEDIRPPTNGRFADRPQPPRVARQVNRSTGLSEAPVLLKVGSKAIPCVGRVDARTIPPLDREMGAQTIP